jgi:hypothetical protein
MATILWGHGQRDRGEEKTFVPQGLTVKWYADMDETLLTKNGFLAIDTGDFGTPTDEMGPGNGTTVEIYNYLVAPDLEKRDLVALLNEGSPHELKFVGADVERGHLCNDVDGCKANGSHKCDGVFGKATVTWRQDPQLVILVCRGLKGAPSGSTRKFGSDDDSVLSDFADDVTEVLDRLIAQVKTDPEGAEKIYDGFPQKSQIYGTTDMEITGWLAVRWASDYGRKGDIPALFKQLEKELNNKFADQFVDVPRYADGLTAAATSKPEEFFGTLDITPGTLPKKIAAIPGVVAAKQALAAKKAKFAADTWIPDNAAVDAAQAKSRGNVKAIPDGGNGPVVAGGAMMLVGTGHNPRVVAYVERQADYEAGVINVTKGSAFSKGGLKVSGISGHQALVEKMLSEFSEKKVTFE